MISQFFLLAVLSLASQVHTSSCQWNYASSIVAHYTKNIVSMNRGKMSTNVSKANYLRLEDSGDEDVVTNKSLFKWMKTDECSKKKTCKSYLDCLNVDCERCQMAWFAEYMQNKTEDNDRHDNTQQMLSTLTYKGNPISGEIKKFPLGCVNCGRSNGGAWNQCSRTCAIVSSDRMQEISSPKVLHHGMSCKGTSRDTSRCNLSSYHGGGIWARWGSWTACSNSCGTGAFQWRSRHCLSTTRLFRNGNCTGSKSQKRECSRSNGKVNGGWANWSPWTPCDKKCGGGQRRRYRTCSNPIPSTSGMHCRGTEVDVMTCNNYFCEIPKGWGPWASWTNCSKTCGQGNRQRYRHCFAPLDYMNDSICKGNHSEFETCHDYICIEMVFVISVAKVVTSRRSLSIDMDKSAEFSFIKGAAYIVLVWLIAYTIMGCNRMESPLEPEELFEMKYLVKKNGLEVISQGLMKKVRKEEIHFGNLTKDGDEKLHEEKR